MDVIVNSITERKCVTILIPLTTIMVFKDFAHLQCLYQFLIIVYLLTLHIRALVVVPCGSPKKSPRTFI